MSYTPGKNDPVFSKNIVILSGHGALADKGEGKIRGHIFIPAQFTITLWTWTVGDAVNADMMLLDDEIGNLVDSGKFEEAYLRVNPRVVNNRQLPITYIAGEKIPNLMILPPRRNNTGTPAPGHKLYTVERPGSLDDFLANMQLEMGSGANVHWSACSEIVTRRAPWGLTNVGKTENLFDVAERYY